MRAQQLAHSTSGDGLPVVMLHGWGASSLIFEQITIPTIRKIEDTYRFICFDLPGHGKNGRSNAPSKLKRKEVISYITESIIDSLDSMGIKEFALIGYSFGATLALEISAKYPNRVRALIVNDAIINGKEFEWYRRFGFQGLYFSLKSVGNTRFILKIINNNWAHNFAKFVLKDFFQHSRPKDNDLRYKIDEIKEYDKRNTDTRFWAEGVNALFKYTLEDVGQKIQNPVFLITGENVPLKAENTAFRLAKMIKSNGNKNVEVHTIKNAGHHIVSTNPEEFCSAVVDFLDRHYK